MADKDQCQRATFAALEVIMEECAGRTGEIEEIQDGVFAFVPEDARREFDFDTNSPQTEAELEEAIESCMESEWATELAESFCDSPRGECAERVKRRACEGLFS